VQQNFVAPPDDARVMMRWWWFGPSVTKPELEREILAMKAGGIGGFEIQPVYPLALDDVSKNIRNLPYLSEDFLDALRFASEKAHENGMRIDLTLGSGWPYGGPHVQIDEAAACLRMAVVEVPMNAHSGRPELAPYPDWTAQFLVHKTAPLRAYMLLHGELAGSWGVHVRKPDGSMPSIDARGSAYYWLDPRWRDPGNMSDGFTGPLGHLENRAEPGDIAHQPSLAFVPYLVTGDRFFADEMAYWANFCLIGSFASDDNRKGAQGLLIGNEVRGIGWGLRNLGDAAAYLPDTSPMKAYLASKVMSNLAYLDQYANAFVSGPLQTLFPNRRPEDGNAPYQQYMWISLWEQSYVAWAVDRVMQHRQVTPAVSFATAGATIRNRIARLQLNLFTHPQWPKDHDRQAPYLLAAARRSSDRRITYFQTFLEMAAATFSVPTPSQPDFVRPFEGYYGPEARLLLLICEGLGDAKATEALDGLMADVSNNVKMIDDLNRRSGWAIAADGVNPGAAHRALSLRPAATARKSR